MEGFFLFQRSKKKHSEAWNVSAGIEKENFYHFSIKSIVHKKLGT